MVTLESQERVVGRKAWTDQAISIDVDKSVPVRNQRSRTMDRKA